MQQKSKFYRGGSTFKRSSNFGSAPGSSYRLRRRPTNVKYGNKRNNFSEKIDFSKFIKKSVTSQRVKQAITHKFTDFNLSGDMFKNLERKNYLEPTPIQDQAIEPILKGRDLIGLANTGTGKTAAFLLPMIEKVLKNREEKVLIIAPTRELALQIDQEFRSFSENMKIFSTICVGGAPIYKQINGLKRRPNFIIGTPGRLKDLGERSLIRFQTFNNIVLDEIDRMLDMGFVTEITAILEAMPKERQSLFFSATLPEKIKNLAGRFLNDPVLITVKTGETTDNVEQDIIRYDGSKKEKFDKLTTLLSKPEVCKVLIFSETKKDVDYLTGDLSSFGFRVDCIHGNKKQRERERALHSFKNNKVNILVATDVAARGLDIKDISHVINYTIPQTYNDYIHRIGRTGRGSKEGMALTFVT